MALDDMNIGGNDGLWLFAILALLGFGGGIGANRNGELSTFATAASQQEILFGQQFQGLDNKMDRLGNGIADATYALNNAITGEGRAVQNQLATCCCENQRNVDSVRFDMANYNAATAAAIHAEGEATRHLLQQNKIESLQSQINQLQLAQATAGVVRYPSQFSYSAGANPFCGCGCNNI